MSSTNNHLEGFRHSLLLPIIFEVLYPWENKNLVIWISQSDLFNIRPNINVLQGNYLDWKYHVWQYISCLPLERAHLQDTLKQTLCFVVVWFKSQRRAWSMTTLIESFLVIYNFIWIWTFSGPDIYSWRLSRTTRSLRYDRIHIKNSHAIQRTC